MDRNNETIRLAKKAADAWRSTDTYHQAAQIIDMLISALEGDTTLTPPNEWVSAEERLPTDERPVLVFVGYADTMTGFITTSSYFCFDANPHWQWDGLTQDEQKTLFWMPLPEPPGKEG